MTILKKFVDVVEMISEFFGWLSQMIVVLLIVIGFGNVVLRYVGQYMGTKLTSNAFIEWQWYLYTLVFLFGFAYILKNGINVRVDFWFANQSDRRKAWIDLIGHLLALIPFCILAIYVTWNPVLRSWGLLPNGTWGTWEISPDPDGLPRAPIKSMVIVAFVMLLLQAIAEVIKLIATLRGQAHLFQLEKLDAPLRIE
ncbi:MAG: TRAP transporter small permease subunit [Chloroflexi bacterium]|nr:TRAP transporter small permease subunit [Chloroflexota bacterium]